MTVMMSSHILVVDDDDMSRSIYLHLFNAEGYKVSSASDGEKALHMLDVIDDIDLIITDVDMPVISGVELVRSLKEKKSEIPVLVVSSHRDSNLLYELKDLGYNDYLSKPVRLATLRESVKNILERKRTSPLGE